MTFATGSKPNSTLSNTHVKSLPSPFLSNSMWDVEETCASEGPTFRRNLEQSDLFDGTIESYHYVDQGEFDFRSVAELEDDLKFQIRRFNRAFETSSIYAYKWHRLQEDLENDPVLKKMFDEIQMIRKLRGYDV